MTVNEPPNIAVIGGGLAGLAAAVAAAERGMNVELFEQAKTLGGRAASFVDSETGQLIDYGQHVAMGCCTSLLDFCRRTDLEDCFERHRRLHFIATDGSRCDFAPSAWLPAPLHLLPGLMKLSYLSWIERWGIVGALRKLTRQPSDEECVSPLPLGEGPGVRAAGQMQDRSSPHGPHPNPLPKGEGTISNSPPKGEGTVGEWLRRNGQSQRAIERFWSVVLVSALSETIDHASLAAAQKVFCDGFLASRTASDFLVPRFPLGEIFHTRLGMWLSQHGVAVHLGTRVQLIEGDGRRADSLILADGTRRQFDFVIVAVPWRNIRSLLSEALQAAMPGLQDWEKIQPAAITAVHLWFDRPITRLPHAVLIGRLGQWVFANAPRLRSRGEPVELAPPGTAVPGRCHDIASDKHGHYFQVVISASHRLEHRTADELLAVVCRELRKIWPEAQRARLLHSRVVTQPSAAFSMQPGIERLRPPQQTPLENLFLAGDWTSTGWPATMEGAVRSGYLAMELVG